MNASSDLKRRSNESDCKVRRVTRRIRTPVNVYVSVKSLYVRPSRVNWLYIYIYIYVCIYDYRRPFDKNALTFYHSKRPKHLYRAVCRRDWDERALPMLHPSARCSVIVSLQAIVAMARRCIVATCCGEWQARRAKAPLRADEFLLVAPRCSRRPLIYFWSSKALIPTLSDGSPSHSS